MIRVKTKRYLLSTALFICSFSRAQTTGQWTLVSDYDDTIKVSHVNDLSDNLGNVFSEKFFGGMAELLNQLQGQLRAPLQILSNSPTFLRDQIEYAVDKNDLMYGQLFLRNILVDSGVANKTKVLNALSDGSQFMLFGDDAEHDPEIFQKFLDSRQRIGDQIFIHRVRGTDETKYPNITFYSTAFDVALSLYRSQKLDAKRVLKIGQAMTHLGAGKIMPHFMVCPNRFDDCAVEDTQIREMCLSINKKLRRRCPLAEVEVSCQSRL